MSLQLRKINFILYSFVFFVGTTSVPAHAEMQEISIKTISTLGAVVNTNVHISIANSEWKRVEGEELPSGSLKYFIEKCDGSVKFRAEERDSFGFYTRRKPEGVKYCELPEVVFDDYVRAEIGLMISPELLKAPEAWIAALGNNPTATDKGRKNAEAFQAALANSEYGYVAIASSEIAASLRKAGLPEKAYPFETLSVYSTLTGVYRESGVDPSMVPALERVPSTGIYVMSREAKDVLEQYQLDKLGVSSNASGFGKTGWETMRHLSGGQVIDPDEWAIPAEDSENFNPSYFAE